MKTNRKLTTKQEAVITEVVRDMKKGEKLSVTNAVERIYNVTSRKSAAAVATKNLADPDFRVALLKALEERDILGPGSKVENRLVEGLDAEDKGETDYRTRLEYIKEIHKIAGVYAPDKHETRKMTLNLNMSKEELEEKIKALKEELD